MAHVRKENVCEERKEVFEEKLVCIGDSGASTHMTNSQEGFISFRKSNMKAQFARVEDVGKVELVGEWRGRIYNKTGDEELFDEPLFLFFSITQASKRAQKLYINFPI